MVISEFVKNRLNYVIETGGIGVTDEVDEAAEELNIIIKNKTKNIKPDGEKDKYIESFTFSCFNSKIKIKLNAIFYDNRTEYDNEGNELAAWIEPYKWIYINVPFINGIIEKYDLMDAIQHELEHAYQNIKMGHGFGNQEAYAIAFSRLNLKDEYERTLAHIIYTGTRNEQDAMINGLYRRIKEMRLEKSIDDIVKESNAYRWLGNLYLATNFLINNENNPKLLKCIEKYKKVNHNFNYNTFKVIALKGCKEFEWKLGRLIKGAKKRFMLEFNVRGYINPLTEGHYLPNNYIYFLK